MRSAVTFQITIVYHLHPGLFRVRVLAASRGHVSGITVVYHALEGHFLVDILVIVGFPKFRFQKIFANKWSDGVVLTQNVNTT